MEKTSGHIKNPPLSFLACAEASVFARALGSNVAHLKAFTSASFATGHWCHWPTVPLLSSNTSTTN